MDSKSIISDEEIARALSYAGFKCSAEEGRLMLVELMVKAAAGFINSHTEELFLREFLMLRRDRSYTVDGRRFLCSMLYRHSVNESEFVSLSRKFRHSY